MTSPDRLIFSTDYPFQQPTREQIETFLGHLGDHRQKVESANAASLFRIDTR